MRFQRAYLIGFALHFFLLVTVASRDFFAVLADGSSYLPAALEPRWRVLEDATFTVLGQKKKCRAKPIRYARWKRITLACSAHAPYWLYLRRMGATLETRSRDAASSAGTFVGWDGLPLGMAACPVVGCDGILLGWCVGHR